VTDDAATALVRRHRLRAPSVAPLVLDRPRITEAIAGTPAGGTCVLAAATGFGATTALSLAIADIADRTAWVSLDALDGQDGRLWAQLRCSVEHAMGAALPIPSGAAGQDVDYLAALLVDWLAERPDLWIVLDGLDPDVHRADLAGIDYLSGNLPPSVRLAVTTAFSSEALPIARTRQRVTLTEIDLALRTDEAVALLDVSGDDLDVEEIDRIVTIADGWTMAVTQAAAVTTHHVQNAASAWLLGKGAGVVCAPVLDGLRARARRFLLQTAFLDELSAGLCDAVRGADDSATILDELDRRRALVFEDFAAGGTLAGSASWRRHPLLTRALRHEAHDDDHRERHGRAADWYRASGDVDATMTHLVSAGRTAAAGEFLRSKEGDLLASGQADQALTWYAQLADEDPGQRPIQLLRIGWGRALSGDVRGAQVASEQLNVILAALPAGETVEDGMERLDLVGEAQLLRAHLASMSGDTGTLIVAAQRAVDAFAGRFDRNSHQAAPTHLIRGYLWTADIEAARRELDRVEGQPFENDMIREVSLAGLQAQCQIAEGRVHQGAVIARRAFSWLASQGMDALEVASFAAATALALSQFEAGDAEDAASRLRVVTDAAIERGRVGDHVQGLVCLARVRAGSGHLGAALVTVNQARQALLASAPGSTMAIQLNQVEALIRLTAGDALRCERLIQSLPSSTARTLLWARLSLERQAVEASRVLASLQPPTPRTAAERQLLMAIAASRRSARLAGAHLVKAADIAGEHGMGMLLAGSPPELIELAEATARREGHDALATLVERVRSASDGTALTPRPALLPEAATAHARLSAGEVELLSLLPGRDSNLEMAVRLGVSVNTVKTRLHRLYRKLGANSRDDAIRIARSRSLLPPA
jgi:LuxR family transcriptional regulator, maltose regulon positive regulatory protein